jgi:hypothetical protein
MGCPRQLFAALVLSADEPEMSPQPAMAAASKTNADVKVTARIRNILGGPRFFDYSKIIPLAIRWVKRLVLIYQKYFASRLPALVLECGGLTPLSFSNRHASAGDVGCRNRFGNPKL